MTKLLLFVAVACSLSIPQGTKTSAKDPYEAVPAESRDQLRRTASQMVQWQKEEKWDRLYDLLDPDGRRRSREDFVRWSSGRPRLLSFKVTEVWPSPKTGDDRWLIFGCGVFLEKGRKEAVQSVIFAKIVDAKWSVSTVLISGGEVSRTMPCW